MKYIVFFLASLGCFAQNSALFPIPSTSSLDASTAAKSRPNRVGSGAPTGNCQDGETYHRTDPAAGQPWQWVCQSNVWNPAAMGDPGSNGLLVRTAAGTTVNRSIVGAGVVGVSNQDGTAGNPSVSLNAQADGTVLSNISGVSSAPSANSLTSLIDHVFGNTQGGILYRNATVWTLLGPGTSGQFLQTLGASANPQWANPTGSGTVNSGTQNQIAYYAATGSAVSGVGPGSQFQPLVSQGSSTAPSYGVPSATLTATVGTVVDGDCAQAGSITLTGATLGDPVFAGVSVALPSGVNAVAKVTAANTVTVELCNLSESTYTAPSAIYKVALLR